ncbi:lysylphosphatidylglycerol synthase transmembrane domain-containing protein [Halalkalicoccus paucihalophilus]|uniref:lysylphosphatidylglycerol synthase transmembrane domain-containing protein n=1 Tax=Halalkalicoccus paucihalophilus TaxID=1008153 RepID=UPI001FE1DF4A|nr:lysylphosphatidylglycerol synthase transmembrane domain-containing protein [Halalkalicoccus paucihalophilus]
MLWGLVLRTVLDSLEISISGGLSFFVYTSAAFANNVTPFGQAGGEPIAALLISKVTNARYETGLASIATVDMLNVVPSLSLILVGVSYYATTAVVGERLQITLGTALALIASLGLLMSAVWRYQGFITDELPKHIAKIVAWCPIGTADSRIIAATLSRRIHGFFDKFSQIATQRHHLAIAFSLSLLGWLLQAIALVAAFAAIGYNVPLYIAIFVIPLGNLAGAAPLPGGLGGIEDAFIVLLVPTTGLPVTTVTAAVLIYRGVIYWLPVIIGGSSMAAFSVRTIA